MSSSYIDDGVSASERKGDIATFVEESTSVSAEDLAENGLSSRRVRSATWQDYEAVDTYLNLSVGDIVHLSVRAGLVYFGLVFAAGFVFGIIRELWVVPRFGVVTAQLLEAPLMLVVIVMAAQWAIFRYKIPSSIRQRLGVGAIALICLLFAEATFVLIVRQLTLPEYIASRDPISGTVYLVLLVIYALMPLGVRRDV